ncbi:Protein of unknown function [Cotesia congregata]|uniref:RNase H type-1 domain-containing protein n=1 Tax=Cotesia congregata TaxID=51543 RepID=A0A8J2HL99_COTCN|nr:Protein of unknown function [Cotesia congregata]
MNEIDPSAIDAWFADEGVICTRDGKSNTLSNTYIDLFNEMLSKYTDYIKIYTDGSTKESNNGCAVIFNDTEFLHKLPTAYTSFSCEAYAINEAIISVLDSRHDKGIILMDSKSTLENISNLKSNNPLIIQIQNSPYDCSLRNKEIMLAWIPSHVEIAGNKIADAAAKTATQLPIINNTQVPPKDLNNYGYLTSGFMVNTPEWEKTPQVTVKPDVHS